jgi:hypothetical protein
MYSTLGFFEAEFLINSTRIGVLIPHFRISESEAGQRRAIVVMVAFPYEQQDLVGGQLWDGHSRFASATIIIIVKLI